MKFIKTRLNGAYLIELEPKEDDRGFFARSFCKDELLKAGLDFHVVQASQSLTFKRGTIRGLHFQGPPKEEDRIVQCIVGKIYDVVLDLRRDSSTFGQWFAEELSGDNGKMIYVPRGFAHGFQTLVDNSRVQYFMSEFYSREHALGIRFNDPLFNIKWPIKNPIVSQKDKNWPLASKEWKKFY